MHLTQFIKFRGFSTALFLTIPEGVPRSFFSPNRFAPRSLLWSGCLRPMTSVRTRRELPLTFPATSQREFSSECGNAPRKGVPTRLSYGVARGRGAAIVSCLLGGMACRAPVLRFPSARAAPPARGASRLFSDPKNNFCGRARQRTPAPRGGRVRYRIVFSWSSFLPIS